MALQALPQASPQLLPGHRRRQRRSGLRGSQTAPYFFLLPFGIVFVLFFLLPIGYALLQSMYHTQRNGLGLDPPTEQFTGLTNFGAVFSDPLFLDGVRRVLIYGVVYIPIMLLLALTIALMLDSTRIRFRSFLRLAIVVPYAIPNVIAALLWGFLYSPTVSPILRGLQAVNLGLDPLSPQNVLWGIANISIWEWTGYNMIIVFSALQTIPNELYDAARIDGCTEIDIARYIKIPLVSPALVLTGIFSIIATLQLFNEPRVLSAFALSVTATFTPNLYTYTTAFTNTNYDYAAALAFVLALVTFVFSFGFLRTVRRYSGI